MQAEELFKKDALSQEEGFLCASLGVYGAWLVKNGKGFPSGESRDKVMSAYAKYCENAKDNDVIMSLIEAVDEAISFLKLEPIAKSYEEAMREFLGSKKMQVVYRWQDGREEVRYERSGTSQDAKDFMREVESLQRGCKKMGDVSPYFIRFID